MASYDLDRESQLQIENFTRYRIREQKFDVSKRVETVDKIMARLWNIAINYSEQELCDYIAELEPSGLKDPVQTEIFRGMSVIKRANDRAYLWLAYTMATRGHGYLLQEFAIYEYERENKIS